MSDTTEQPPLEERLVTLAGRLEELRQIANARFPSPPEALGPIHDAMLEAARELTALRTDKTMLEAIRALVRRPAPQMIATQRIRQAAGLSEDFPT